MIATDTAPSDTVASGAEASRPGYLAALFGGLLLLAAVCAYVVNVLSEGATHCGAVIQRPTPSDPMCHEWFDRYESVAVAALALGLLLFIRSAVSARDGQPESGLDAGFSLRRVAAFAFFWCWLYPLALVPALLLGSLLYAGWAPGMVGDRLRGLPGGWTHLEIAVGVVCVCLIVGRSGGMLRGHAVQAASFAVPAVLTVLVIVGSLLGATRDNAAALGGEPGPWAAGAPLIFAALLYAARRQQAGKPPLSSWVSVASILTSCAFTTLALLPQIAPWWREAEGLVTETRGGPGPAAWLPLLVASLAAPVAFTLLSRRLARE